MSKTAHTATAPATETSSCTAATRPGSSWDDALWLGLGLALCPLLLVIGAFVALHRTIQRHRGVVA